MGASDLTAQRVNLAYEGPYFGTMLWVLITFVVSIFIIPAAWATAFLYRRILSHVTFSDGTAAAFRGLPGRGMAMVRVCRGPLHSPQSH